MVLFEVLLDLTTANTIKNAIFKKVAILATWRSVSGNPKERWPKPKLSISSKKSSQLDALSLRGFNCPEYLRNLTCFGSFANMDDMCCTHKNNLTAMKRNRAVLNMVHISMCFVSCTTNRQTCVIRLATPKNEIITVKGVSDDVISSTSVMKVQNTAAASSGERRFVLRFILSTAVSRFSIFLIVSTLFY